MENFDFPALNALLNGTSALLLAIGRRLIALRRIEAHRNCMIAAVVTSSLFLASYLYYHFAIRHGQATRFTGEGIWRIIYFSILGTHTALAATIVPLVSVSLIRGLRRDDEKHRRVSRWTFPLWMYVSVTGVLIYFMLYQWFPVK
jgi:uncharacterized membrane protein YozB (DUF420 family)